jgi:hypothetical protein
MGIGTWIEHSAARWEVLIRYGHALGIVVLSIVVAASAAAAPISIVSPGFDVDVLPDGGDAPPVDADALAGPDETPLTDGR